MRILFATIAIAALPGPVLAQSETETAALMAKPFEEAIATTPDFKQDGADVSMFRFIARRSLADLNYPIDLRTPFEPLTDPDTISAIKAFEEKAGGTVDGSLSFEELGSLMRLASLARLTPISPGAGDVMVNVVGEPARAVFATGTWFMPNIAWPLNRSEISCFLSTGRCEDASVTVSAPSAGIQASSWLDDASFLVNTNKETYEIQSWKDGILDAVTTSQCRRVRLTINTLTMLVSQTAEDLDPQGCEIPGSDQRLDPIGGVRVATLIAPFKAQQGYQQRMQDMVRSVSGPLLHDLSARDSQR
jgi:hypothetical protein